MGYLKLTELERELLNLVPVAPASIDTKELVKVHYGDDPPFHARPNIVSRMTGIAEKLKLIDGVPYLLMKTNRSGPNPISYQRVEKIERMKRKTRSSDAKKTKRKSK